MDLWWNGFFEALNESVFPSFLGHIFGQFYGYKSEVLPHWAGGGGMGAKRGEGCDVVASFQGCLPGPDDGKVAGTPSHYVGFVGSMNKSVGLKQVLLERSLLILVLGATTWPS